MCGMKCWLVMGGTKDLLVYGALGRLCPSRGPEPAAVSWARGRGGGSGKRTWPVHAAGPFADCCRFTSGGWRRMSVAIPPRPAPPAPRSILPKAHTLTLTPTLSVHPVPLRPLPRLYHGYTSAPPRPASEPPAAARSHASPSYHSAHRGEREREGGYRTTTATTTTIQSRRIHALCQARPICRTRKKGGKPRQSLPSCMTFTFTTPRSPPARPPRVQSNERPAAQESHTIPFRCDSRERAPDGGLAWLLDPVVISICCTSASSTGPLPYPYRCSSHLAFWLVGAAFGPAALALRGAHSQKSPRILTRG